MFEPFFTMYMPVDPFPENINITPHPPKKRKYKTLFVHQG